MYLPPLEIVDPSRLKYTTPEFVTNANDFLAQWSVYHREGDQPLLHLDRAQYGNMYKVVLWQLHVCCTMCSGTFLLTIQAGDPVLIEYSNGFIGYFSFPSALNSQTCHDSNPIGMHMLIVFDYVVSVLHIYVHILIYFQHTWKIIFKFAKDRLISKPVPLIDP